MIGPPAAGRATARWQYFFLNGRYIRDRFLNHALREGYRGLIDPDQPWTAGFSKNETVPADCAGTADTRSGSGKSRDAHYPQP